MGFLFSVFLTSKRSLPLALALMGAALAPAQSVNVSAAYRDGTSDAGDGGSAPYTTYRASVDHNDYGRYFHRASAAADFRTAKLSAQVDGDGVANASASVRDTFRITRPEGGGDWGVAYAWVRAHAVTHVNPVDSNRYDYTGASGQSTAVLNLTFGLNSFSWKQQTDAYSLWEQENPGPTGETFDETRLEMSNRMPDGSLNTWKPTASGGDFYLPFYFRFGTQYDIRVSAWARAYLFNGGSVDTDFSHTYQWQGIDKVYALDGAGGRTLVSNYAMTSGSGTDYAAPVPEPASMMALGAGFLALLRRRRS